MTTLKIISHHNSLGEAVEAAKPVITCTQAKLRKHLMAIARHCSRAFIVEGGDIYYVYEADINVLNRFSTFCHVIDDSPFSIATINGDVISISEPRIPKTPAGRAWFRNEGKATGALAALSSDGGVTGPTPQQ